jgi:hypothetical protein
MMILPVVFERAVPKGCGPSDKNKTVRKAGIMRRCDDVFNTR